MTSPQNDRSSPPRIRFSRGLGPWQVAAQGLAVVLAAIVFALPDDAVSTAGRLTWVAVVLAALLIVLNVLGYAELAVAAARPGAAYELVHERSRRGALPFLTGWALVLSGAGLCALLAQAAAEHLSLLSSLLLGPIVPTWLLAMGMVALVTLVSAARGWRGQGLSLTLPMIGLLTVLAILALPRLPSTQYAPAASLTESALPLLAAAFVGVEVITGHQAEMRRRKENLPRALLLVPSVTAALGGLVAAVVGGSADSQLVPSLVSVGDAIAGSIGKAVILATGSVVLILSFGRMLSTLVRHVYLMAQDGFWPSWLRRVHPRRGVPTRLTLAAGTLTLLLVYTPTGLLAQTTGLLYLLVLVAVNLTLARGRRQGARPRFALPFHPWIPALIIAVDILVIPLWGAVPVACGLGCLAAGGLIYLGYGRRRHAEAQDGVTVFRPPSEEPAPAAFRVLVPIANPATAGALIRIAGRLAGARGGDVLALQVTVVPEPVPLDAGRGRAETGRKTLERALAVANAENLPVQTMTRVARSVAQGILDTAAEEETALIVLGWAGPTGSRAPSLGRVADAVLRDAPCDVLVVRGEDSAGLQRILVPTAGGPHARAAARLAATLAQGYDASVTFLCVQVGPASPRQMKECEDRITDTLKGLDLEPSTALKAIQASSVVEGIVQEALHHDMVLLGVSEESLLDRIIFGSIPLQVATRVPNTALVQGYRGLTGLWTRRVLRAIRNALPSLGEEEQLELHRELARGAQPGIDFFVFIVLSCIIAAVGLLLDSPAVVIGAMLVAPLMSPILAFSLGLVMGDLRVIRFSIEAVLKGAALAAIIASFIGLLSPLKTLTDEMLARARPNLLDLAVALASGMAGAYALARKDVSAALPGVSIAAALMPPLATVGLALSLSNARVAGGALLLLLTNIAAISLGGGIVFLLLGVRPQSLHRESRRRLGRRLAGSLLLLLVIAVPLGITMANTARDTARARMIRQVLEQRMTNQAQLVDLEVERENGALSVVATMRVTEEIDRDAISELATSLSDRLGVPVHLEVIALPVVRSAPSPKP